MVKATMNSADHLAAAESFWVLSIYVIYFFFSFISLAICQANGKMCAATLCRFAV